MKQIFLWCLLYGSIISLAHSEDEELQDQFSNDFIVPANKILKAQKDDQPGFWERLVNVFLKKQSPPLFDQVLESANDAPGVGIENPGISPVVTGTVTVANINDLDSLLFTAPSPGGGSGLGNVLGSGLGLGSILGSGAVVPAGASSGIPPSASGTVTVANVDNLDGLLFGGSAIGSAGSGSAGSNTAGSTGSANSGSAGSGSTGSANSGSAGSGSTGSANSGSAGSGSTGSANSGSAGSGSTGSQSNRSTGSQSNRSTGSGSTSPPESGSVTTVDIAAETNSTVTISGFEEPSPVLTPTPEATNFVAEDVAFQSLVIKANATSYQMGGLLPITAGGMPWLAGVQYVEAFKCQLNILNSNSRILPRSFVTYRIQNTDLLVSAATQQALLLEQANIFMTVGPMTDNQVPPVGYLNAPEQLAFTSFDASSTAIANSTFFPSFFRTIPSDIFQARAMAEIMKIFGWSFIASLYTTDAYGASGRNAILAQTGRQRIKVTCTNSITPGSTSGLASFANCVAESEASVVVLWMDEENAANALSFLYRNSTNTRLTFIASDRWAMIKDPASFNDTVARTGSSFPLSFIEGTIGIVPQIGQLGQFKACMTQVDPTVSSYPELDDIWEQEFRCKLNATDTIPPCPDAIDERTEECRCTGEEDFSTLPADVH